VLRCHRELDDALGLTDTGVETLADVRTGKNGRHRLAGLLRQSVLGRLAGYEDVRSGVRTSPYIPMAKASFIWWSSWTG
jgi:hypothetical protein